MIKAGGKAGVATPFFWTQKVQALVSFPGLFKVPGATGMSERNLGGDYGTKESPLRGARYPPARQSARAAQSSRARASISAAGGARASGGVAVLGLGGAELEQALCEVPERNPDARCKLFDNWKLTGRTFLLCVKTKPT